MQPNTPDNTLVSTDQIDGGANSENHLSVTMRGHFAAGMGTHTNAAGDTVSNIQNIQEVELVNPTNQSFQFNAQNTQSVDKWVIDNSGNQTGSIELFNLPETGITVALDGQAQGAANIAFATSVVTGSNDAMTIELDHVGTAKSSTNTNNIPVNINTRGVEYLTLDSTGTAKNLVNLAGFTSGNHLVIAGEADIAIIPTTGTNPSLPAELQSIDGSATEGDITITTTYPEKLANIQLGSGDDTFTASQLYSIATINGGAGDDELVLKATPASNYRLNMSNVETLTVRANTGNVSFDGSTTTGLETINADTAGGNVTYTKGNQANLDMHIWGNTADTKIYTINGVQDATFIFGDGSDTTMGISGTVASDSKAITIELDGTNVSANPLIKAANANTLTIDTGNQADTGSYLVAQATSALGNINTLVASGRGNVDLSAITSGVGITQSSMYVDATALDAQFKANFDGTDHTAPNNYAHTINVRGSATGENIIKIGKDDGSTWYDQQVTVTGSTGDDTISIVVEDKDSFMDMVDTGRFVVSLYDGINQVNIKGSTGTINFSDFSSEEVQTILGVITGEGIALNTAGTAFDGIAFS